MNPANYFDHAATSPLDPRVKEAMLPWMGELFGNPHSLHQWGVAARDAVERSREIVASALGAEDPSQIVFNSGATEGNNWVLRQVPAGQAGTSPFEHSSIREPAARLHHPTIGNKLYDLQQVSTLQLCSIMLVSNETGAVLAIPDLGGAKLHRDITQAPGHVAIDLTSVDFATLSAHKCGGPQGVGILYIRNPHEAVPTQRGGGHEGGLRSGTLNVAGIVGAAIAVQLATQELQQRTAHALRLRQVFLDELRQIPALSTDPDCLRSPHILSLSHPRVLGEALAIDMDRRGFAISAGAACSSESDVPSHTLMALEYAPELARGTVRISFGNVNTEESAADCAKNLRESLGILQKSHTIVPST